jgi:hypothetical protein
LLPLILLTLPGREAIIISIVLIFVNLLEWPILLSRGEFTGLWWTILLRTGLLGFLGIRFWSVVRERMIRRVE